MKPLSELSAREARGIRYVLTDIDDTLTEEGKLSAEAYGALWKLQEAGFSVIPVTGRPAGWCDLIIRQWPVDAVVGENGAFVYYFEGSQLKTFTHPSVADMDVRGRLAEVGEAVYREVPGSRQAKDQFSRIYDLAIDFNEDPPFLGLEAAEKIKAVCEGFGATAKISSIHVNTWFGDYDKLSMVRLFLSRVKEETDLEESVCFFGDSPNDEPLFSAFPLSVGVANIKTFSHLIKTGPGYITDDSHGRGFAQGAQRLLALKKNL